MPHSRPADDERPNGAVSAYLRSYVQLKAFVTRRVGCASTAADIVHDTYIRLAERGDGQIGNPEGYARRVAGNLAIDWQRREAGRPYVAAIVPDQVPSDAPSPEQELEHKARLRRVLELAAELPPKCREVFVLRKLDGLHQDEIAARLNISPNMVQKHLRKALAYISARVGG